MGINTSKIPDESSQTSKNELNIESNLNPSDPRSPTPEIIRTPLQEKSGGKHNITKNVDLRKTFENVNGEEKLIHNNPILSAVIKNHLQSYDPRSPTQEFERTPIIISSKVDEQASKKQLGKITDCYGSPNLNNDSVEYSIANSLTEANARSNIIAPKNLCEELFDVTLNDTITTVEEPLCSSTASNEALENNNTVECDANSKKLLETNFDYVDDEKFEDSQESVENCSNASNNDVKFIPQFKILNDDPRSPTTGIERTPIVVAKIEKEPNEESVEEMSDDKLIKVLQDTNADLRQSVDEADDKNNENLLIYEDRSTPPNTPKKSKSVNSSGSRTPLSCMKNKTEGHIRSKSENTLLEPKGTQVIPSKIPKRISQIPRLKALSKRPVTLVTNSNVSLRNICKASAISGDCENKPPHSNRDKWDKDNSIIL